MTLPDKQPGRRTRVLIYSHDSFGLGHLRRCRTVADALVADDPGVSVLILSGSPIIGRFDFGERVDFVRIPGIIKLENGEYTNLTLGTDLEQTLAMRAAIIRHTAEAFDPDLFIVDKEPLGLRGEVRDTLLMLRDAGCPLVLGLRDVLDDPAALAGEWERKGAAAALTELYDEIWVYGLPQVCDPLDGLPLPPSVRHKTVFTGYLRRPLPAAAIPMQNRPAHAFGADGPYLLVTAGGGGDGAAMLDWVLRAYESGASLPLRPLFVLGPFMPSDRQAQLHARIQALPEAAAITFDAYLETLIDRAAAIVSMGGYNTFCEVLSFDKPTLIVPRERPRREQRIRAERAAALGLATMLRLDGAAGDDSVSAMVTALRQLSQQPPPSMSVVPGLLDGIGNVQRLARRIVNRPAARLMPLTGTDR
jgi:predicted glycosyltransferase